MKECILETKDLSKTFGKFVAVDGVSIVVPKGKIYGLLGPNGAGKSTLLKMICGMITPTSGSILLNHRRWERQALMEIGALIEQPPIYPHLSAYENCRVRALVMGVEESRIDEVLGIVSLRDTGKKKAGKFSMGMKQRLGIALALLHRPQLLILDEPTNGLDPIAIKELRGLIRGFVEEGTSVILSSHILSEVEHMADEVGILVGGHLGYEGTLTPGMDLEGLFLQVVKENGGGVQ